ncbi:MAG: heavy metal translocating P-type ATPase, partial [Frankiales bacterium]|nr:heavy metal translocating P-type ATPase [Frankiales bacterium]
MRPRLLSAAVGLTALALAATGCTTSEQTVAAGPLPAVEQSEPAESPATLDESLAPSASPSPSVSPSPSRPPKPTYDVKAVQTQLAALHYYGGAIDGERGPALRSAVMAFQKVQGIGADGVVGKGTLAVLKAPREPVLRATAPASRVEVDLTRQVLYVVSGGAVERILPVSSGNGRTYEQKDGSDAKALTPVGWYEVQRRIVGERKADLGSLYDPQYFYRGWAIHGSNSVPAYPASHGCVRVTRADAKYLLRAIGVGTSVYVYGGTHTFTAGSSAPGTDNPTGDTPADAPAASPSPTAASPRPSAAPASPAPSPS